MNHRGWSRLLVHRMIAAALGAALGMAASTAAHAQGQPERALVPESFELDETAQKAINAAWLNEDERSALRVFHGVWDERDLRPPAARAIVALNAWKLDDPVFEHPEVAPEVRAEARLMSGQPAEARALVEGLASLRALRIRAEADLLEGQREAAEAAIKQGLDRLLDERVEDAAELTEGVRLMMVRARLQGQPSRDFQTMMSLLARARGELDRLHWPAMLVEAQLLVEKDNEGEAIAALHQALALNPRCAEAWRLLADIALSRFDFASAGNAVAALERLSGGHPLAAMLEARSRLVQDDPEWALAAIEPVVARWPRMLEPAAWRAAALGILYDIDGLRAALAHCDALAPGNAWAHFIAGRQLSLQRQYELAAELLEESARRQPGWPAPLIELGLLELQSGRDDQALAALRSVATLDPFNKRAANSLFLLEELHTYERIETPHFVVRYKPGIDEVTAKLMPETLERLYETVTSRLQFEPDRKTVIEVLPDHQRFGVRITGMPGIHTIAACTGPVIAMEVPREGAPSRHMGLFDWPRVLQHEFTHTVTLAQTSNRIPHWFTEAVAVRMELAPRTYGNCVMLASSLQQGTLFGLEEIKWAFVRPRQPGDRGKAYAQGHWMVEYIEEQYGMQAIVNLLAKYDTGLREAQAIPQVLGVTREQFFEDFKRWAGGQVEAWGLGAQPSMTALMDEVRLADPTTAELMAASRQARAQAIAEALTDQIGVPATRTRRPLTAADWPDLMRPPVQLTDEHVDRWMSLHPDHPDVIEIKLRRAAARYADENDRATLEALEPLLEKYAALRPVDPYPHRKLAQLRLSSEDPAERARAIPHLEALDVIEEKTPIYALELAGLYRASGDKAAALAKARRAVNFNPYNAPARELAAACAIEAGRLDIARLHLESLLLLEPDRPQHQKRLEALKKLEERR